MPVIEQWSEGYVRGRLDYEMRRGDRLHAEATRLAAELERQYRRAGVEDPAAEVDRVRHA